jgi:hypothetical protein
VTGRDWANLDLTIEPRPGTGRIQPSGIPGETPENRSGQGRTSTWHQHLKRYVKDHFYTIWGHCTLAGHEVNGKRFYYYAFISDTNCELTRNRINAKTQNKPGNLNRQIREIREKKIFNHGWTRMNLTRHAPQPRSADCLNPQRGDRQKRLKVASRFGLAERCELGQFALRNLRRKCAVIVLRIANFSLQRLEGQNVLSANFANWREFFLTTEEHRF